MDGTRNEVLQESEFVKMLVRSKVISDAQLKAVYDYQRSVGGSVVDILVKLNMMPRSDLEAMLHAAMRGQDVATAAPARSNVAIDATKLETEGLKLHHRLVDKIPSEIVERYLLTVFFPGADFDSRKLIVGHGRDLPDDMADRIRSLLGVDLYTLHLNEAIAADFVVRYLERARKPVSEELESLLSTRRREERAGGGGAAGVAEENPGIATVVEEDSKSASEIALDVEEDSESAAAFDPEEEESASGETLPEGPSDDTGGDTQDDHEFDPAMEDRTTQNSTRGVSRMMNDSSDAESTFGVDSSTEWAALLNLLVKKSVLTREEVRVEIELLKRNKTRF